MKNYFLLSNLVLIFVLFGCKGNDPENVNLTKDSDGKISVVNGANRLLIGQWHLENGNTLIFASDGIAKSADWSPYEGVWSWNQEEQILYSTVAGGLSWKINILTSEDLLISNTSSGTTRNYYRFCHPWDSYVDVNPKLIIGTWANTEDTISFSDKKFTFRNSSQSLSGTYTIDYNTVFHSSHTYKYSDGSKERQEYNYVSIKFDDIVLGLGYLDGGHLHIYGEDYNDSKDISPLIGGYDFVVE
ncbi:MAG: hypothetical protein IJS73_07715 [Paludibacteraceae bacterium]|nr:hypothetical protein [Paludibacteraceae bacterium]